MNKHEHKFKMNKNEQTVRRNENKEQKVKRNESNKKNRYNAFLIIFVCVFLFFISRVSRQWDNLHLVFN